MPFALLPRSASLRPRNTPLLPRNTHYQGGRGAPMRCGRESGAWARPQGSLPASPWLPMRGRRDVGAACALRRILNPLAMPMLPRVSHRRPSPGGDADACRHGDGRRRCAHRDSPSTGRRREGVVIDLAAAVCPAKCEVFDPQNAKPSPSVRLILRPYLSTDAGGTCRLCAGGGCRCGRRGFEGQWMGSGRQREEGRDA